MLVGFSVMINEKGFFDKKVIERIVG